MDPGILPFTVCMTVQNLLELGLVILGRYIVEAHGGVGEESGGGCDIHRQVVDVVETSRMM
jgi:hypothetical protein